jgi:FlaA1/EpsC-like NDP-sugar epimerase
MLKLNFNWDQIGVGLRFMMGVALALNAVLFFLFKSYAGIIRYTNLEDTSRLVMVNAIAAFFYLVLNIFFLKSGNYFTLQIVAINFFITSFVIISYRLTVRYVFNFYKTISHVLAFNKKFESIKIKDSRPSDKIKKDEKVGEFNF